MKVLSNVLQHPKTSAAGVLIGLISISQVLSQQGITLGKAGTGSKLELISGLASAALGLLARDPATPDSKG